MKGVSGFWLLRGGILLFWLTISGCATYYQQNIEFQNAISAGEYSAAVEHLENDGSVRTYRNRLLYYLEKGTALHMAGDYLASNDAFEQAYIYIEDFMRNYGLEAFSFLTNPTVVPYPGEDFERVQIHYFKALNFALTGNLPDALVECRRINIKLNEINDNYESGKKNHYSGDAFAWNLMGIFHDAAGEFNNAFICYRNALEIYQNSYTVDYGLTSPARLTEDLLTAAHRAGLSDELRQFKESLNPAWQPSVDYRNQGEVIVFWNNGLGPIKTEDSVNFFLNQGDGGVISFVSEDQNLWLPVPASGSETGSFKDLSFIRMTLPRYLERSPLFTSCRVTTGDQVIELERAQNLHAIAVLNLQDRMGRELGKALLRTAIKYGIEQAVRKQDEAAGMMVSILNAITENADTRNWQTLPYEIHYARFSLPEGTHQLTITRNAVDGSPHDILRSVEVMRGRITFLTLFDPGSFTAY